MTVSGSMFRLGDGRLVSQTDTGPGKIRRRTTAIAHPFTGSWVMRGAQLDLFEDFVATALQGGSLPFTLPSPRGGEEWLVRIAPDGMPSIEPLGNDIWRVSVDMERLP